MKFALIILASALSGYAIGEIGQKLGLPLWVLVILGGLFGWVLGGTLHD